MYFPPNLETWQRSCSKCNRVQYRDQWRTQKIFEGGQVSSQSCDVTIVWCHKSTLGEVPKARPF